jgi:hypothetical protein
MAGLLLDNVHNRERGGFGPALFTQTGGRPAHRSYRRSPSIGRKRVCR